jgi:hypothetical protein
MAYSSLSRDRRSVDPAGAAGMLALQLLDKFEF